MTYILDGSVTLENFKKVSSEVVEEIAKELKNNMSLVFYENGSPICVAQNENEIRRHIEELSASRYIGFKNIMVIDTDYGKIKVQETENDGTLYKERNITYRSIGSLYDIAASIINDPEKYKALMND